MKLMKEYGNEGSKFGENVKLKGKLVASKDLVNVQALSYQICLEGINGRMDWPTTSLPPSIGLFRHWFSLNFLCCPAERPKAARDFISQMATYEKRMWRTKSGQETRRDLDLSGDGTHQQRGTTDNQLPSAPLPSAEGGGGGGGIFSMSNVLRPMCLHY
jgi:hypothetical protein